MAPSERVFKIEDCLVLIDGPETLGDFDLELGRLPSAIAPSNEVFRVIKAIIA
jgi:hypothetical protein